MNKNPAPHGCDFFDVDHTIVNGSTGLQSLLTGIELQILPWRTLYSVPKLYLQYNYGSLDTRAATQCIRDLKGIEKTDVQNIGELNYRKRIRSKIFTEAEACIAHRASLGRTIVLLTSSFTHVIEPLARHLCVEHVLANELLYDQDRTSGYLREPFLFGEEKKVQALAFMAVHGFTPQECSFFTDSINDRSLLDIVGEPVAVNPDRRLRKRARAQQWRIEIFRSFRQG
jgi:HAD superfamily hydrolase (TIGR01490 family)